MLHIVETTMIAVLQKAEEVYLNHPKDGALQCPKISDIPFDGENEIRYFYIAVQKNYIQTYDTNSLDSRPNTFSFQTEGRLELDRLLEKREAVRREEMFLQYAKAQLQNSWYSLWVAGGMLLGSLFYFGTTAWALYYSVRPDTSTVLDRYHHKHHKPHKPGYEEKHENTNENHKY